MRKNTEHDAHIVRHSDMTFYMFLESPTNCYNFLWAVNTCPHARIHTCVRGGAPREPRCARLARRPLSLFVSEVGRLASLASLASLAARFHIHIPLKSNIHSHIFMIFSSLIPTKTCKELSSVLGASCQQTNSTLQPRSREEGKKHK